VRNVLFTLLALALGGIAGHELWRLNNLNPVDPVEVVLTQLKTHAVIEHERQLAIWYRVCPAVFGKSPEIFMAWPAKLVYQIELDDVQVHKDGGTIKVRTSAIHPADPSIPTDFVDHMASSSIFTFANEEELVNHEVAKATPVARYLTTYFLAHDPSLPADFRDEIQSLVEHFTSTLGIPISRVEVEIPPVKVDTWPKLPKIELCAGSLASVNGLPFAKFDLNATIPIGFHIPLRRPSWHDDTPPDSSSSESSSSTDNPRGIASVVH
jgi:hypothetical protein